MEALPVSEATPVVLALELLEDEVLEQATLVLRRATHPGPAPTVTASSTSTGGSFVGVEWVMATWDRTQSVEALSLAFTSKPNPLLVRVRIARGGSGWYLPPGPHTFTLGAAMALHVVFPDTTAERVLVEFLDAQGSPVAVDLSEADPLTVRLGREPRDLDLRIRGHRPLLRWSGAIPAEAGIAVNDLHDRLETELGREARAGMVVLELRAAVAGELSLDWAFGTVRIGERFPDGTPARTIPIPRDGSVDQPLLLDATAGARVERLTLSVSASPVAEQLVLAPNDDAPSGEGQLVRPLYEAARAIQLPQAWSLTGFDVLARALVEATSITLALHPDTAGRPAASAAVELLRVLEAPMAEPAWIAFDIATPLPVTAGIWWLMLRVDQGELVWLSTTAPEADVMLHRRDRGTWLTRAGRTAATRVRAVGAPPKEPLSLWLRGAQDGGAEWEARLSLADDGVVRWSAGPMAPLPSDHLALRIVADVPTTVTLSNLQLRYRTP